ncbi:ABC transporter permease [Streptomyces sp. Vc714c-19]|uniref:ABC transporter permease n=1 Tax=unclassified Streptomyces TaxID=2593676 RepID=UPI001BFBF667|nr:MULTISPECIES: ABC transporter permease [unclassified Streptomyces]MBT3158247.1 ABC transporter permease [Streptomyces sp. G11C]MCO6704535.1 ABC transporter permease [Streptomyces sp. CHB9.2]MCO6710802.1 ABC transporter permease [Streptomyces sp. CHA3]MCO6716606.1 ABC transporter permease [Streptomyces sp. CHB19.2]MCO6722743.1 ABC transporter permease [Streptomyces sp. Vc714c-19]
MGLLDAHLIPAVDGVAYGLLLFVVASGLSLAFGTAGVLNLSHGMLYAVGAYTGAELSDGTWGGLLLGLAAGTTAACLVGAGLSAASFPLARRGHLAQALLTFGLALIGGDLLIQFFGADDLPVRVPAALDTSVSLLGHRYPAYRLCFIVMAVLLAAFGTWVLVRTRVGAAVRAAADDPQMLAATGYSPRTVHLGVLAAAGALAGAAGVLGAPIIGPGPGTAETVLMLSLVVVVLGGLRSLWATFFAAIGVGEVQTLGVSLAPGLAPYLLFAAMAAVLVLRSRFAEPATGHGADGPVPDPLGRLVRHVGVRLRRVIRPARPTAGAAAWRRAAPLLVLCAALVALPGLLDAYTISLAGSALALGLLAVSVTVLTGYAGLPTLGQTAPFAVGAYTTANLAAAGWTVGPVQILLSALTAAVFSAVTGPAVIRARGTTVLMITLAVGELTSAAVNQLKSVTGGADGLVGFPATQALWGGEDLFEEGELYTYALVVAAVAVAATLLVLRSPAGKLLTGARGAEARMRASGHPVWRYLLVAYIGAGALAGVGGSVMVTVQQYLSPADVGFEIAAFALLAAVIGGTTSVVGALFGAGLIVATRDWVAGAWPGHGPLLLGVLFVAAVYLLPRGLAGLRDPSGSEQNAPPSPGPRDEPPAVSASSPAPAPSPVGKASP